MFSVLDISASGLYAQRVRMDTIANNMANLETTRDAQGRAVPFRRQDVVFKVGAPQFGLRGEGVEVPAVVDDPRPFRKEFKPDHPDAIREGPDAGYVLFPNIDPIVETVNMIDATRAYEANVTVMDATKSLFNTALRILA